MERKRERKVMLADILQNIEKLHTEHTEGYGNSKITIFLQITVSSILWIITECYCKQNEKKNVICVITIDKYGSEITRSIFFLQSWNIPFCAESLLLWRSLQCKIYSSGMNSLWINPNNCAHLNLWYFECFDI